MGFISFGDPFQSELESTVIVLGTVVSISFESISVDHKVPLATKNSVSISIHSSRIGIESNCFIKFVFNLLWNPFRI